MSGRLFLVQYEHWYREMRRIKWTYSSVKERKAEEHFYSNYLYIRNTDNSSTSPNMEQGNNDASKETKRTKGKQTIRETHQFNTSGVWC